MTMDYGSTTNTSSNISNLTILPTVSRLSPIFENFTSNNVATTKSNSSSSDIVITIDSCDISPSDNDTKMTSKPSHPETDPLQPPSYASVVAMCAPSSVSTSVLAMSSSKAELSKTMLTHWDFGDPADIDNQTPFQLFNKEVQQIQGNQEQRKKICSILWKTLFVFTLFTVWILWCFRSFFQ